MYYKKILQGNYTFTNTTKQQLSKVATITFENSAGNRIAADPYNVVDVKEILIQADAANSGDVLVGASNITDTAYMLRLSPGDALTTEIDLESIWVKSVANNKVSFGGGY